MVLKSLLFVSLLTLISLFADTSLIDAEFRGEAKAKITFLEKQNVELKTKLDSLEDKQKSVEEYKAIIDRQDKRVEDINAKMAWAAEKTSWLSVIVGILTLFAGFVGFMTYRQNEKAKNDAKEDMKVWKENTLQDIVRWQKEVKSEFDVVLKSFKEYSNDAKKEVDDNKKLIKDTCLEIEQIQQEISQNKKRTIKDNFKSSALNKFTEILQKKPMIEYTFDDWNSLAFEAYIERKQADAAFYWNKAIELTTSLDENYATALCNKGIALGEAGESQKAIETFRELIKIFHKNKNKIIKEQVGNSIINLFELQLRENEEFDIQFAEPFEQYWLENKQAFLKFKMLQIVKNALQQDQTLVIEQLKQELSGISFSSWSWKELDTWAKKIENIEVKKRVQQTIEIFKNWDKKE